MAETHRHLLLEIGLEELPARYCTPALDQLKQNALKAFADARLDHERIDLFGTPRRLVLCVRNLSLRQRDHEIVQKGPSRKVAFDAEGKPTIPAQKFAASQGIAVEDLELQTDEKGGEYLFARRIEQGQSIAVVLPPLLAGLVTSIDWPKSMRWADRSLRYARPIKWLLALLGTARVPFDVDGIQTVKTTMGHRTLGPALPMQIENPDDYFIKMGHAYVMFDQQVRKQVIWQQVGTEAQRVKGHVRPDADLLEEITWLVEQPTAFTGSFDPAFLDVPPQVLVTTMKENQRYFPVYRTDESEELLPYFIAVRNGEQDSIDLVRAGNEKVLAARLSDARFFWDEDRKQPLASYNERLGSVVFQAKLGTQKQRVERLVALAPRIAIAIGLSDTQRDQTIAAAAICKADLTTKMVFEFPEVQGYMGKHYLLREGTDPAVAEAVYEHYLPRGAGDDLPKTGPGIALALADRLDTLAGYFSIDMIPTGSQDPFALRRAAQGVIQNIVEHGLHVDLRDLAASAAAGYGLNADALDRANAALSEFFQARVKVIMEGRGLRYDVIDAALASGAAQPFDAVRRAETLTTMLKNAEFAAVTGAFKRVMNLVVKADEAGVTIGPAVDPALFIEPAERDLHKAWTALTPEIEDALKDQDYLRFYMAATRLKTPVDAFLDQVRVNADDLSVRANRYRLLAQIGNKLMAAADLGRLVG